MKARSLVSAALWSGLFVMGCAHRSTPPTRAAPARDPSLDQRPPPGTRIETWPDLGGWSVTGQELPGSSELFLWEKAAVTASPKAQVPHRLHRPVE